jgi:hypothetical protein
MTAAHTPLCKALALNTDIENTSKIMCRKTMCIEKLVQ